MTHQPGSHEMKYENANVGKLLPAFWQVKSNEFRDAMCKVASIRATQTEGVKCRYNFAKMK